MIIVETVSSSGAHGSKRYPKGTRFSFDSDGDLQIFKGPAGGDVIAAHFRGTWSAVYIEEQD